MNLSELSIGRDNNFNLIRMAAALAVLITHSFALAIGTGSAEPFRESIDMTMGSIAVDVFFLASGFLVTCSLINRQSAVEFVWARVLRIFPALVVMMILTVFGVGVYFTVLPLSDYLTSEATLAYLVKGVTLLAGVGHSLPGVFDGNPYKSAINGSLWTMPSELRMYVVLLLLWIALRLTPKTRLTGFQISVVGLAVCSGVYFLGCHYNYFQHAGNFEQWKWFFMFFVGASSYVLRERIILSARVFWLIVLALTISLVDKQIFFVVYTSTIAYILLYLAYVPAGSIRIYNRIGDYSYGVYIYAFPVQQAVAASISGVTVLQMLLISAAITIVLAALSWHLLESRCLGLKGVFVEQTRRLLA